MNKVKDNNKQQLIRADPFILQQSEDDSDTSYETEDSEAIDVSKSKYNRNGCKTSEDYINIRKKSSEKVVVSKKAWELDESSKRRQKFELELSVSHMEEASNMDQHHNLQMRYERMENVMEALLQYLDCLNLEVRASYRLSQQLNGLIVNEKSVVLTEGLSQLVKRLCEGTVLLENHYACKQNIRAALARPKELDGLMSDYNQKKGDFNKAAHNFKVLLQNANLNVRQMERLQHQFDGILLGYQHSRCLLDQALPGIISRMMQVLLKSFNELCGDLQKIASDRTDLSSLLKHLETSLRTCNNLGAIKGDLHGVPLG